MIPRSKVVGVGSNYRDHAGGDGRRRRRAEPLLFLKPNTSVVGPGDAIVLPAGSRRRSTHEGELAIVIGKIAKNVSVERCGRRRSSATRSPTTSRRVDLQKTDGQWARAKGFDTFCPLGPVIETEFDLDDATLETRVNGEIRQQRALTDMVHSVAERSSRTRRLSSRCCPATSS